MNENLDLADKLLLWTKYQTHLYSTLYGDVRYEGTRTLKDETKYIHLCSLKNAVWFDVSNQGAFVEFRDRNYRVSDTGEITLFPSKTQRDWDKFEILDGFRDGDVLIAEGKTLLYAGETNIPKEISIHCYINDDDGSVYVPSEGYSTPVAITTTYYGKVRLATVREAEIFHSRLASNKYYWNKADKKVDPLPYGVVPMDFLIKQELITVREKEEEDKKLNTYRQ